MPLGILFWVVYVIAVVFGFWLNYDPANKTWAGRGIGGHVVIMVLIGMLGWGVFGPVVKT